jgi:uroporphyrinogen III methyltransferase/synthase
VSHGKVYIVGAGPGSPDLISLRGYRALLAADAVLADQLLPASFLDDLGISSADKLVEWLGDDHPRRSQEEINRWLIEQARHGRTVARLKGGDAFVFGRGEDEAAALSDAGIAWEVIPGPSASTAVPTSAGFPLTRHARGRSFAVATARVVGGAIRESFPRADTLVILMGVAVLDQIVARLLADGWSVDTPAAAVERGTLAWERRVAGTLEQLPALARQAQLGSPATLLVGTGAAAEGLVQQRPTVLFTGLDPRNFSWLGNLLHWPAQKLLHGGPGRRLLPQAIERLGRRDYAWVLFTDRFAVTSLLRALQDRGADARVLGGARLAALGPQTAARLEEHGLSADVCSDGAVTADVMQVRPGQQVLVVLGTHLPDELSRRFASLDVGLTRLKLHRLVPHPELGRPLPDHDLVYFVSPAAVDAYWQAYGPAAFRRPAWSIGTSVEQRLARYGIESRVVLGINPALPAV